MRRLLSAVFFLFLVTSCDDGEIIVTSFDFEDSSLDFCEGPNKNVLYVINNDNVNESIALQFSNSNFQADEDGNLLPPQTDPLQFSLTGNNRVVYRLYDGEVPNDYFCNVIPPSEPAVIEEWISGTGGTVVVTTRFTDETGDADPDNDGLKNSEEGWVLNADSRDTDSDGIPDYLDIDDDNDNVSTINELANSEDDPVNAAGYRDTDEDGLANYLDPDDDNDNIPTRFEVTEGDEDNPETFRSAEGIPNYLNPQQTASFQHDVYLNHDIRRNYGYQIIINNLKFEKQDGSGESIQFETYNFGTYSASSIDFPQCPAQDPACIEE